MGFQFAFSHGLLHDYMEEIWLHGGFVLDNTEIACFKQRKRKLLAKVC